MHLYEYSTQYKYLKRLIDSFEHWHAFRTMTTSKSLTLKDYSTFQYMLASPDIAKDVLEQVVSFVFYDEPFNCEKSEKEHKVLLQGKIDRVGYYFCCLWVLPSHVLGISQWLLAAENEPREKIKPENNSREIILRQFKYTYFGGHLKVDTRHVLADEKNKFRIVEFMEISKEGRFFSQGFVLISRSILFLEEFGLSSSISILVLAISVSIPFHFLLTFLRKW